MSAVRGRSDQSLMGTVSRQRAQEGLAEGAKRFAANANVVGSPYATVGQPIGKAVEWNAMRPSSLGGRWRAGNIGCGQE